MTEAAAEEPEAVDEKFVALEPKRYPSRPRLQSKFFVEQADYPIESWQADEEGTVRYAVDVSSDGEATGCKVVKSSGSKGLDDETCPLVLKRAMFNPALNENGENVDGIFIGAARWRKEQPTYPGTRAIEVQWLVDENGQIQNCEVLERRGQIPKAIGRRLDIDPCSNFYLDIPYRDANGVPVARVVRVRSEVMVIDPKQANEE